MIHTECKTVIAKKIAKSYTNCDVRAIVGRSYKKHILTFRTPGSILENFERK